MDVRRRERRGSVSPVICVASGDLVVTLVSVPQQTTTLFFFFVPSLVFVKELFLFELTKFCVD